MSLQLSQTISDIFTWSIIEFTNFNIYLHMSIYLSTRSHNEDWPWNDHILLQGQTKQGKS